MTEADWLASPHTEPMVNYLLHKASNRKLRWFACACCRTIWQLMADSRSRTAVEVAERFADGLATGEELAAAYSFAQAAADVANAASETAGNDVTAPLRVADAQTNAAFAACGTAVDGDFFYPYHTATAAAQAAADHAFGATYVASMVGIENPEDNERALAASEPVGDLVLRAAEKDQAILLRDIFGNPFRPVAFAPEWRTDTVLALARQMYESRDFSVMPILADALQDAGCDSDDILNHCRDASVSHVRGCWVVDLVLGKG